LKQDQDRSLIWKPIKLFFPLNLALFGAHLTGSVLDRFIFTHFFHQFSLQNLENDSKCIFTKCLARHLRFHVHDLTFDAFCDEVRR